MINKFFIFLIVISTAFLSGCLNQKNETAKQPADNFQDINQEISKDYDLSEIAKHNSKDDCWLLIENKVYNVSDFISSHPGGQSILQGCGKEATELFSTRPMGSGTPHSQNAVLRLQKYFIGNLKK